MKITIIASHRGFGGVAKATETLHDAFITQSLNAKKFYIENGFLSFIKDIFKCRKFSQKSDALILMHFNAILLGIFLKILGYRKVTLINVIHTDLLGYYQSINLLKKGVIKLLLFIIKKQPIVFVSKEAELRAKHYFKFNNTTTIYNVVDFIKPKSQLHPKNNSCFTLGAVSRLDKTKNLDILIRVFDKMLLNNPDLNTELIIYGDGDECTRLLQYTQLFKSHNKIHFLGYEENTYEIYQNIDALISFSSIEGLPISIIEALKYQKPIFHTACHCGPTELLLTNNNSFIKEYKNYIHTDYGFLITPIQKLNAYYNLSISDDEVKFSKALKKFISYYTSHQPKEYDFTLLEKDHIVSSWVNFIKSNIK